MKKLFLLLTVLGISLITNLQTVEAVSSEKIRSFSSNISIDSRNVAHITETIVYDFDFESRHGIYRDIPIDYKEGNDTYYVSVKHLQTVDENNKPVQAETSRESGNERIRLGDPDKTVTGKHTYKISYELWPVIYKKDDRPFLNLDVLGTGWKVPIEQVNVSIHLENNAQLSNIRCFYGTQGSRSECPSRVTSQPNGTSYSISLANVYPYQGVTINANIPNNYTKEYLEPNQLRSADLWGIIAGITIFIVVAAIIVGILLIFWMRWWRARSRRKAQIVVAQYAPPTTMTPAEMGHLADDSSDMAEVTATLINLAVRGYLKITQEEKKGIASIFGGKEYVLHALKPSIDLQEADKLLYDAFFSKGEEIKLSNLNKSEVASAITKFKSIVKASLEDKGFYDKKGGIIQKGNLTDAGAKEWALVEGFKLYLNVVEKDRLAFSDAPEKTPERFNTLLPYAIALGVEEKWAKQFEGIDLAQSTGWYSGTNLAAFSAIALTSDLSSGFAATVSSNSSVSSSGGSSGGGFGGGGGGSW